MAWHDDDDDDDDDDDELQHLLVSIVFNIQKIILGDDETTLKKLISSSHACICWQINLSVSKVLKYLFSFKCLLFVCNTSNQVLKNSF